MYNQITIFKNPMFGEIRAILDENNEPWFIGKEVAMVLGYVNTKDALSKHVDAEDKLGSQIATSGQRREMTIINESGLYSLILSSKLPQAKEFKRWVTSEVLPSIRKNGGYLATKADDTPEVILSRAILLAKETIDRLEAEKEVLSEKAEYLDQVILCEQCYTTTTIAKELGLTVHQLTKHLKDKGIIFMQSKIYMLYADYASMGLAKNRTAHVKLEDGSIKVCRPYIVWTEKGRQFIHNLVKMDPPRVTNRIAAMCAQPTLFTNC